jgi:DNA-binding NtrC family response regulator
MDRPLVGRSILIVEDEPLVALDVQQNFEAAGARVLVARSLQTALAAVEDPDLSAAVLDHALRDGDSSALCERLKERNIPFVLHTGYGNVEGACKDGVLIGKPINLEMLVTTVEQLLSGHPDSRPSQCS